MPRLSHLKYTLFFTPYLGAAASSDMAAESANICVNCQTEVKAIQYAKSKANPLQCSDFIDMPPICSAPPNIVTFVDNDTEKPYRYKVYYQKTAPWSVRVEPVALSAIERQEFADLMSAYKAFNSAINEASQSFDSTALQTAGLATNKVPVTASGQCPQDTA